MGKYRICGRHIQNRSHVCAECQFSQGEVWVLNPETWKWEKEIR